MKIAFNIFYGVFIGLLILLGALFLLSMVPFETGIETKIVQSGSMEPTIPVGALVVIKPKAAYEVGDIITFGEDTDSAVPTTHRILAVREADGAVFYTTKGDANEEGDAREVAQGDVIGKVYVSVPYAGFVLNFARQPLGFALLIVLPAALVILAEFAAIVQEIGALWKRRGAVLKRARRRTRLAQARRPYSVEYVRLFETDDVFIPVRIFEPHRDLAGHRQGTLSSTLAVLSLVVLTWYGTSSTLSYFRDTELSTGNTFAAGTWLTITGFIEGGGDEALLEAVSGEQGEVAVEGETDEEVVQEGENPITEGDTKDEDDARARGGREDRDAREERGDIPLTESEEPIPEQGVNTPEEEAAQEESISDTAPEAPAVEPVLETES
ncbi:signal peptidase I [Candidatus Kaiserbacteria bacterium]|nr:signal peptidase I [Candidatus Kaiserbacteria bacterium]